MWKSNTKWENLSGLHFDWNVEMLLLHSFNSSQQYRTLHEGAKEVPCQICHLPHLCLDYKKMFKGQNFYHTFIVKVIIILEIQRLSKALGDTCLFYQYISFSQIRDTFVNFSSLEVTRTPRESKQFSNKFSSIQISQQMNRNRTKKAGAWMFVCPHAGYKD